jgi:hypothetical protein
MDLDFTDLYKDYATIELLKIVQRPGDYQPEAVDAARKILENRQVDGAERQEAEKFLEELESQERNKKETIRDYREKAADFLEPVLRPGAELKPGKFLNLLLLVMAIQYAWLFYKGILHAVRFVKHVSDCWESGSDGMQSRHLSHLECIWSRLDIATVLEFDSLLYIPLIIYLLYKRRRWSWILLFADNLFSCLAGLAESYSFFKYQSILHGNIYSFLLPIMIRGAFTVFLYRKDITGFFGVEDNVKKRTVIITVILTFLFVVVFW